jgi:hypothetical protein
MSSPDIRVFEGSPVATSIQMKARILAVRSPIFNGQSLLK